MNALAAKLTEQERQIIVGLCNGLSFPAIADVMRIQAHAVRVAGWRMYPKIGAANSVQAAYLWGCGEERSVDRHLAADIAKAAADIALGRVMRSQPK